MIRCAPILAAALLAGCSQNIQTGSAAGASNLDKTFRATAEMRIGGYAFAPPAFYRFCSEQKALCSTKGATRKVELTPGRRAELDRVNRSVNRSVRERSDPAHVGGGDRWELPAGAGDCEDFAILKKAELIKRGWPASALLLTVVTSAGRGHTVLTVRTTAGDLVLDNFNGAVKPWSKTSYRYFARQSPGDGRKWERISS